MTSETPAEHPRDDNPPRGVPAPTVGALARAQAMIDGYPFWAEVTRWPPGPQTDPNKTEPP